MARETAKPPARVAFRDWQRANPSVKLATFADAVRSADVVINATSGVGAMSALEGAGADALGDRILIDVSNPLDFSKGMPPTLTVCNTDSLGEQLQQAFPQRAAREDAEHGDGESDGESRRGERGRSHVVRVRERRRREGRR